MWSIQLKNFLKIQLKGNACSLEILFLCFSDKSSYEAKFLWGDYINDHFQNIWNTIIVV